MQTTQLLVHSGVPKKDIIENEERFGKFYLKYLKQKNCQYITLKKSKTLL